MRQRFSSARLLFAAAIAVAFAGCGTSPAARMYTLSPLAPLESVPAKQPGRESIAVSVAAVELPDYLDRSQIVTRDGANGLKLAEFDRWGGSLGDNITTVLVENLSGLLTSDRVVATPGLNGEIPDFRVAVRILRLDAVPGEQVELKAQWLVTAGPEKQELARGLSTYSESLSDKSYDQLVAAVSRTVGQLSREIAGKITTTPAAALSTATPEADRP